MKINKYQYLVPLTLICFSFSCGSSNPYTVIKDGESSNLLKVNIDESKWKKEYNTDEKLSLEGFSISFEDKTYDINNDRITKFDDIKAKKDGFFVTTSDSYPFNAVVDDLTLKTSNESTTSSFYICHCEYVDESQNTKFYLSKKYEVKVNNSKALKTWVKWVFGFGVIILASLIVFAAKKYKEKHP